MAGVIRVVERIEHPKDTGRCMCIYECTACNSCRAFGQDADFSPPPNLFVFRIFLHDAFRAFTASQHIHINAK